MPDVSEYCGGFPPRGADLKFVQKSLTRLLFDLLCRNPDNRQDLHHDLNRHIHHLGGQQHRHFNFNTSERGLNTLKYVDESFLA